MDQRQSGATQCSVCGTALQSSDRFCPSCGAPNPAHVPSAPGQPPQSSPPTPQSTVPQQPHPGTYPSPPPGWAAPPPPPQPSNRRTWFILGGIFLFFILVCCCCALLIAIASSQDSALQEELEGTARIFFALT